MGVEYNDVMYQQGDAPGKKWKILIILTIIHLLYVVLCLEFSREDWLKVKFTLGLDFPNVSVFKLQYILQL